MLVDGIWTADWDPVQAKDENGGFIRQTSSFRNWVTVDGRAGPTGGSGFKAEAGRYHLYVALICPWASRALMMRKLKKLDNVISVSVVEPFLTDQGWKFGDYPGADHDTLNNATYMHEIYTKVDPSFTGRATVPVLWDKQRNVIVNNESADIIRMLNSAFDAFGDGTTDLYPTELQSDIDELCPILYNGLNNGVYKSGFAVTQEAYEDAVRSVFNTLDDVEAKFSDGRSYMLGELMTELDIRLFVTLIRFDVAYHGLFKCNIRQIANYPYLSSFLHRILDIPGISETVSISHIKAGYYSIKSLNPNGIIPVGPHMEQGTVSNFVCGRAV
ncbi:glutathione S-transferase family protein [Parasphingorhabdus flavimaris]|uniref:glutathione S-transferase family protein n=1 Tax=Parasphingorhabdus flavimaris TaxID=266812 RepID=UPI0030027113